MQYLSEQILEALSNANPLHLVIIVLVALIVNLKKIIGLVEDLKSVKIGKLKEALECELVTGATRALLEQELVTEHFKRATGLRLEKSFREAVIQAHNNNKGELEFVHFKRARSYLSYKDSNLAVDLPKFELVIFYLNLLLGFLSFLFGLVIILFSLFLFLHSLIGENVQVISTFTGVGSGLFFALLGWFFIFLILPVSSARKIKKRLENNNQSISELDNVE